MITISFYITNIYCALKYTQLFKRLGSDLTERLRKDSYAASN